MLSHARGVVSNITAYDAFYNKPIKRTAGLTDISSNFAMEQIKYTTALPIS